MVINISPNQGFGILVIDTQLISKFLWSKYLRSRTKITNNGKSAYTSRNTNTFMLNKQNIVQLNSIAFTISDYIMWKFFNHCDFTHVQTEEQQNPGI